jgi:hypothetical protein
VKHTDIEDPAALAKLIHGCGFTQVEFARLIDYTPEHLNCVLRGRQRGSDKFWRACARVLTTETT